MKEITSDKSNYTFEKRIIFSVWKHEQTQTGKKMNHAWEIFQQKFGHENPSKKDTTAIGAKTFGNSEHKIKFKN
jgi:hypothetical protein